MTKARTPPRFVPTLTTVVDDAPPEGAVAASRPVPGDTGDGGASAVPEDHDVVLEEELVQRILERVERTLDDQISDAVAAQVQSQLDAMVPRLRDEIDKALRRVVKDALVRERTVPTRSDPGSTLV